MSIPNFLQPFWWEKIARNSEWPKLGVPNFFQPFWCKKNWKKFGMAKIGHSEFSPTILLEKNWKKFEKLPSFAKYCRDRSVGMDLKNLVIFLNIVMSFSYPLEV